MIEGINKSNTYTPVSTEPAQKKTAGVQEDTTTAAAVYEKSTPNQSAGYDKISATAKEVDHDAIVAKLKADADAHLQSLKSLVSKLFTKQGETFAIANPDNLLEDTEFWNAIRTGQFQVDEATSAQAQKDIAEDGYWGVEQTSDRLVDFAKAITGGDKSKIDLMRKSLKDGFDAAEKLWGGELPEISKQTYDAALKKLDAWANEE